MNLEWGTLIILGLAAAFSAVGLLSYIGVTSAVARRSVHRSLRGVSSSDLPGGSVRQQELAVPAMRRLVLPRLSRLSNLVLRWSPPGIVRRLDDELVYAGSPPGWDGQRFLALKWVSTVGFVVVFAAVGVAAAYGRTTLFLGVPIAAIVGYYLPEWLLRSRSGRRQTRIRRALPDALDLMSITVEAGLGFDAALERVSREMGGPLGEEFYRVVQEMRLGKGRGEALRDLAQRSTVPELKAFVLATIQAEIFGISIARVLHIQAQELRLKRRQLAETEAQKLPVKLVFPLLLFIFPAVIVVLVGPAAISLYQTFGSN